MKRADFDAELDRLCRGFGQAVTPERADALWRALGQRLSQTLWSEIVDRCLLDPRYPDYAKLLKFADEIGERKRVERAQKRPPPEQAAILAEIEHVSTEYGRARISLIRRIMSERLAPAQTAQELGKPIERFPHHRQTLQRECASLDQSGDSWSNPGSPIEDPEYGEPHGAAVTIESTETIDGSDVRVLRINPRVYYANQEARDAYVADGRARLMSGRVQRSEVIGREKERS
jgi:hypothetical protein